MKGHTNIPEDLNTVLIPQTILDIDILEYAMILSNKYELEDPIEGLYLGNSPVPLDIFYDEDMEKLKGIDYNSVISGDYKEPLIFGKHKPMTIKEALKRKIVSNTPNTVITALHALKIYIQTEIRFMHRGGVFNNRPGTVPIDIHEPYRDYSKFILDNNEDELDTIINILSQETLDIIELIQTKYRNNIITCNLANMNTLRFYIGPDYRIYEWTVDKMNKNNLLETVA